jgi:hypothetical protein
MNIIYVNGVMKEFFGSPLDLSEIHERYRLHREDGPAVIFPNFATEWWLDGKYHREDGPAVELPSGYKAWYINGKRHREDGPAIEYSSGDIAWFYDGIEYDFRDFVKSSHITTEEAVLLALEWS